MIEVSTLGALAALIVAIALSLKKFHLLTA